LSRFYRIALRIRYPAEPPWDTLIDVRKLNFSLDFLLIHSTLTFVDYCAWSAGACSRFCFSSAALAA
jgi:hypothetical protein